MFVQLVSLCNVTTHGRKCPADTSTRQLSRSSKRKWKSTRLLSFHQVLHLVLPHFIRLLFSSFFLCSSRTVKSCMHMRICYSSGVYILGECSRPFPSVSRMIEYFTQTSVPIRGAAPIKLGTPVFRCETLLLSPSPLNNHQCNESNEELLWPWCFSPFRFLGFSPSLDQLCTYLARSHSSSSPILNNYGPSTHAASSFALSVIQLMCWHRWWFFSFLIFDFRALAND